jgi:hypothetical protein
MNLQEQISRIQSMMGTINESTKTSFTNINVNIGDVYDESEIYSYVQKLHYKRKEDFWDGDLGERIEKFKYYVVKEIPISKIALDEYELDIDDMEEYIDLYNKYNSYPPIVLDGDIKWSKFTIIDGTHRANALKEMGFKTIICFVGKNKI